MQNMRRNVDHQIESQVTNGKYPISVEDNCKEFKRTRNSSRILERAALWILKRFMNGPLLASIKSRLKLFSNDANKHESTITSYSGVVKNLIRHYFTDAVIGKSDELIRNIK